jgi:hypothetical protein
MCEIKANRLSTVCPSSTTGILITEKIGISSGLNGKWVLREGPAEGVIF